MDQNTASLIEEILQRRFAPSRLELVDESERHRGHPGATSGGGHFRLSLVAEEFRGKTLLEQHRAVNEALAPLFGDRIHALALKTRAPD